MPYILQGRRNRPRRFGHIARDTAIRARSAVFAGALLAAGAVPPDLDASDEAPAPIVVHADRWEPPDVPEAVILAARLLQREGIEPPPHDAARRTLAREIAAVLSRNRGEYPEVADVVARETYERPGGVILTLEPGLLGSVSRLLGDRSAPVTLRTGHVRFDALNAALGLRAVEPFPSFGAVAFFFDPPFDLYDVIFEYSWIDEVLSAEPNVYLIDGPDLDLSRSEKTWRFVFRTAWGRLSVGLHLPGAAVLFRRERPSRENRSGTGDGPARVRGDHRAQRLAVSGREPARGIRIGSLCACLQGRGQLRRSKLVQEETS